MCFNMSLVVERLALESEFAAIFDLFPSLAGGGNRINYPNRSGFSHPVWPVITTEDPDHITTAVWGLVPRWVKDRHGALNIQNKTLNARGESLLERPSFRSAMKKGQRCLIPVDGFFEPHDYQGKSYPFYIHRRGALFAFAGLFDDWYGPETGKQYRSFSIITIPSLGIVDQIHNTKHRMPLILMRECYHQWLDGTKDPEDINEMIIKSDNPPYLSAYPVSRQIYCKDFSVDTVGSRDMCPTGIEVIDRLSRL